MNLNHYQKKMERAKGQLQQITRSIEKAKTKLNQTTKQKLAAEEAQGILQAVAKGTQEELEYHVSEMASLALNGVFDDPYKLVIDFVLKRGRTEADIQFERDGNRVRKSLGGGARDVAALALRVTLYELKTPKGRPVFILDEPFKHLKGIEENRRILKILKELSEKLNIQIIMVCDERIPREDLVQNVDALFEVRKKGTVSKIKTIDLEGMD